MPRRISLAFLMSIKKGSFMENFISYMPTKVYFGKDVENDIGSYVRQINKERVFIVFGGGSVERSGLLDRVKSSLLKEGISFMAFGGVKPNPTLKRAREGVKEALAFGADLILAIGGGSVIDTAKAIAHGNANPQTDIWDFWNGRVKLTCSTPVAAVLTIPAAGSEMSDSAVLTDEETEQKRGFSTEFNRCVFAVMNPALAMTLPKYQLAAGITDIMMHTMERYFIPNSDCDLTDEIAEGLLRTVIKNGAAVMEDEKNDHAMAEVMWASSISHNGLTGLGRNRDFSVHALGQAIGGKYDKTHGATLSAVWKAWAEYVCQFDEAIARFARFARQVWQIEEADDAFAAKMGIEATVAFFKKIGMPISLTELGISPSDEDCRTMALEATRNDKRTLTQIRPLTSMDAAVIFKNAK